MRILFAVSKLKNGGAERVVANLANEFVNRGYEVGIVTIEGDEVAYTIDKRVKYMPIVIGGNRYLRRLKRISKTKCVIEEFNPDIIFSFLDRISFSVIIANMSLKRKLVLAIRNDPRNNDMSKGWKKYVRSYLFPKADYFVFQTEDERDYFEKSIQERSSIIKNPLSDKLIEPWNGTRDKEIVGVGRLEPQKNWPLLLKAFERFVKNHGDYTLTIYGEGPLRKNLQQMIEESELLSGRVNLPGFVNDVHEKILKSAMFVLPSDFEGLSNAMLESMALGIPTICTDCPAYGAREVIIDGINGILVNVGDVNMLAEKMELLTTNDMLAKSLSSNSIKIREELTLEKIVKEWEKVIDKVTKSNGK